MEDDELVRLLSTGDASAFRSIVEQHIGPITSYVTRMSNQSRDTEDIVQETFLRLWTHRNSFDASKGSMSTWLHRIAHNLVVDTARKKKPELADTLDEMPTPGPDRSLESLSLQSKIAAALSSLPERQRSAVVLNHYQGLANKDIAEILGVSVSALESLLARGRRTLKEVLQTEHEECQT